MCIYVRDTGVGGYLGKMVVLHSVVKKPNTSTEEHSWVILHFKKGWSFC